jgi:hypothetical protein
MLAYKQYNSKTDASLTKNTSKRNLLTLCLLNTDVDLGCNTHLYLRNSKRHVNSLWILFRCWKPDIWTFGYKQVGCYYAYECSTCMSFSFLTFSIIYFPQIYSDGNIIINLKYIYCKGQIILIWIYYYTFSILSYNFLISIWFKSNRKNDYIFIFYCKNK